MRIIKLFILFCVVTTQTQAQIQFDKRYPLGLASVGRKVVEISGGYICAGFEISDTNTYNNNLIVKSDTNGDTVKTLYIPPPDSTYWNLYNEDPDDIFTDLIVTNDSNLVAVGRSQAYNPTNYYDYDILLVKLNYNLDTLWLKTYSHPTDSAFQPQSIIQTSDGGFLICGKQRSFYNTNWFGFLYKVDSAGNFQWYKSYNNPGPYQAIWGVIELPDHSFMCSGTSINVSSSNTFDSYYFIVDSLGNLLTTFPVPSIGDDGLNVIEYSNDNNIMILGLENYTTGNIDPYSNCIYKVDYFGNVIWKKTYGDFYNGSPLGITRAHNGGYVYAGGSDYTAAGFHAYIHRIDENGDSLWFRNFSYSGFDEFWDIKTTADGGYIMCGQTGGCNNNGGTCFWLVKTDSLGLLVTGIQEKEIFKNATLTIYPNPATTYCTITAIVPQSNSTGIGKKGASIILFDMRGKQLLEQPLQTGSNTVQLNLTNYSAGTYLAVLVLDGYNAARVKVVKE